MAAVVAIYSQLRQLNAEVLGISTDSVYAHKIFADVSPLTRTVQYPLVSDRTQEISRAYRVLDPDTGAASRATVIIDPDGMIVSKMIYPREVGRNALEILRLLQGIQYGRSTGLGVPANWVPGMPGIKRDFENVGRI